MATQDCARCGRSLPRDAWHPGKWGTRGTYCRQCFADYKREHRVRKGPARLRGPLSGTWRGDDIGYAGAHARVRVAKGPARAHRCEHCGGRAQHWAYDHADPDEQIGIDHGRPMVYSADPAHYLSLCAPCHRVFDHGRTPGQCVA